MTKFLLGAGFAIVIFLAGSYWMYTHNVQTVAPGSTDYKSATYTIEGTPVTLVNGEAQQPAAPGSASKIVTKYFGNEVTGDLNGDGVPDAAFILTQNTGGSGTFYYVVAAVKEPDGAWSGSDAVLLGDRIAPQTTQIQNGQIIVNYADRAQGEPMTAQPSQGKSLFLKLDQATMQLGQVAQNFEGEANPSQMTLGMTTWAWQTSVLADGNTVTPTKANVFTLKFADGNVSIHTDCNGGGGSYAAGTSTLSFGSIARTEMYCEGSQEDVFYGELSEVAKYSFTSKGELILGLTSGGAMTFR